MAGRLADKVALVTGGGSGIGRATCLTFVEEGARVIVADVNPEGGEETVRLIDDAGGEARFVQADVSRAADVEAMVRAAVDTYGRLDCAFNNAGTEGWGRGAPVQTYPEDSWDHMIAVNLKGVWLCLKYEIAQMLQQGTGAIVNTASIYGLVGGSSAAYAASKHGVVGLTRTIALECAKAGIRVNAVCPGAIRTPMTERVFATNPEREAQYIAVEPIGRLGTAEEVAEAVVWLCSDAASFVTGHAMSVDGGWAAK